jgi:hypothetical protein
MEGATNMATKAYVTITRGYYIESEKSEAELRELIDTNWLDLNAMSVCEEVSYEGVLEEE